MAAAEGPEGIYRSIVNGLPQVIWTCDANGQLEWVNDRWTEVTGLTLEQSLDKRALEAVHPDDVAQLGEKWMGAFATSSPCEIEYRIRTRDGAYRWHLARVTPILDAQGGVIRWLAAAIDIEERRQATEALRASEKRFEAAFLGNPQPMAIARVSDGNFLLINEAYSLLVGFSQEEVVGKNVVTLGMLTPEERAAAGVGRHLPRAEAEVGIRTKDGRKIILVVNTTRIDFGGEPCLLGVVRDVTKKREVEAALRDSEAKATARADELEQAQISLREADRRKDEFLALLSHELRNPLAPIITAAQLMEMRGDSGTPAERSVILRQARHVLRLVDDLLDVSRVTRGKVTLVKKPLDLATVIASAVEATAPLFEDKHHELSVKVEAESLPLDGDEFRLTQILNNLLSNAARYTPAGGRIEISAARDGDQIVVRVRDNGEGIAADLLPEIFDMFVQGKRGIDRAGSGLGLGLALVRAFTELHGGTVGVISAGPGAGSEFTVRLPLACAHEAAPDVSVTPPRRASTCERILVVDDNQDAAGMVAKLLTRIGHDVRVAFDAPAALELVEEFHPQVAIVDLGLPVMDGYTLGRELSKRGDSPPVLVALTGYGQEQDRQRSREAGFAHHLVKPVYVESLVELLETLG